MKPPLTSENVRRALTGPIASIRTPFNRDGSIDFVGVRSMIDFNLQAGGTVSLLTAGDSHFLCLSDDEIGELNKVVIEHTAGRALTVACDWEFATPQATAFAKYCADLGADMLMSRPPDWGGSVTDTLLVEHYRTLSGIIPILFISAVFGTRSPKFVTETTATLVKDLPNILAMKEDLGGDVARKICLIAHPRWAIFGGGGWRTHLDILPYGCVGLMDRHMNFAPALSRKYWAAIQANDLAAAGRLVRDIEIPLEDHLNAYPGGRDAAVHGLIELVGIAGRWRRKPYHSLTDQEMARLKAFAKELGVL